MTRSSAQANVRLEGSDDAAVKGCCSIICPVCKESIVITKQKAYFLLSNFHKHIHTHINEEIKVLAGKKKKRKSTTKAVTSNKRSTRQTTTHKTVETDSDSSSSDADDKTTKAMNDNFEKESDDQLDMDDSGND